MRPIIKTYEEIIEEKMKETAREAAKLEYEEMEKARAVISTPPPTSGSKIRQILDASKSEDSKQEDKGKDKEHKDVDSEKIKDIEKQKEKERIDREKEVEKVHKELEDSTVDCPTCSTHEHSHKLKKVGPHKMKCVGDKCGIEYNLVPQPTKDDYKCTNCGIPHKRPLTKEQEETDSCPLCGGKDFMRYDWTRVVNRYKNKS